MGKPVGSDLMEGTLTLPSLLLMERQPEDNPVIRLFARPENGSLESAIAAVRDSGVLDESYEIARQFRDDAEKALSPLPESESRASLVTVLDYVLERTS